MQVTNVGMENGIAEVKLAEMVTGDVNLRYLHRETREVLEEGNTRPEVILQQLCTRKGQVRRSLLELPTRAGVLQAAVVAPLFFLLQLQQMRKTSHHDTKKILVNK